MTVGLLKLWQLEEFQIVKISKARRTHYFHDVNYRKITIYIPPIEVQMYHGTTLVHVVKGVVLFTEISSLQVVHRVTFDGDTSINVSLTSTYAPSLKLQTSGRQLSYYYYFKMYTTQARL